MLRKIYLFSLIIMFLSWNFTFNHSLVVILIIQHVYAIRVPLKFSRVLPKAEAFSLYFAYLAEYQNHEEILQFCFVLMQILKLHNCLNYIWYGDIGTSIFTIFPDIYDLSIVLLKNIIILCGYVKKKMCSWMKFP